MCTQHRLLSKLNKHFRMQILVYVVLFQEKVTVTTFTQSNETATHVNKFLEKLCLKDEVLTYIDVDNIFIKNGNVVKAYYDKTDASGVHITIEGAQTIRVKLREFLHPKMSPNQNTPRPCDTKRKLSDISLTPMSAEKDSKQSKPGSPDDYE
ncbi:unnamed protein product [Mytilus edulis]|uniref:Uncharacterized protein n=1 Tax=Mytilus edulis TaxID=6550 RepID=A0A8S3TK19_MYTED|nr:unnamed protein product [Mytilus edulis]